MTMPPDLDLTGAPELRFHHVGVACRSIEQSQKSYRLLGYEPEGERFTDPLQGVHGLFITGPGPRLELLQALEGAKTLDAYLSGRASMYHLAYVTDVLSEATDFLRGAGAKVVSQPKPAVAFGGREVTFLILPNMFLIELIAATLQDGTDT